MDTPSLILGATSAAAAIGALYYARKSPTQADLHRVEAHVEKAAHEIALVRDHVAGVEAHLGFNAEQERLNRLSKSVSMKIVGVQDPESLESPLLLRLTQKGLHFTPMVIELLSADEHSLSTISCSATLDDNNVEVSVPASEMNVWYTAGSFLGGSHQKELLLRVHGTLESEEVSRLIRLVASQQLTISKALSSHVYVLILEGSV